MARKKISELDERTDFDSTCVLPLHDSVQTWKTTAAKLLTYIRSVVHISIQAKSANYVILATDEVVTMDATGGNRTLTLPTAVGYSGKPFTLKKIDASVNTVQVLTTSAQTIDGNASGDLYLRLRYDTLRLVSDGANWLIVDMNFGIAGGNFLVSY